MNTHGIQQLKELLVAVAGIVRDGIAANADKKVTKMEIVKMVLGNAAAVITGFTGISEIPAEMADIQPEEIDELHAAVIAELQWPDMSSERDVFNAIFSAVYACIQSWRVIENTLKPPVAQIVPEP